MTKFVPVSGPRSLKAADFSPAGNRGQNRRDLPQALSDEFVQTVVNRQPIGERRWQSRKGRTKKLDLATSEAITGLTDISDTIQMYGHGTTVGIHYLNDNTKIDIKTDFSANSGFDMDAYGGYGFLVNGVDGLWRVQAKIGYTLTITDNKYRLKGANNNDIAAGMSVDQTVNSIVVFTGVIDNMLPIFLNADGTNNISNFEVTRATGTPTGEGVSIANTAGLGGAQILGVNVFEGDTLTFADQTVNVTELIEVNGDDTGVCAISGLSKPITVGSTFTVLKGKNETVDVIAEITSFDWDIVQVEAAPLTASVVTVIEGRLYLGVLGEVYHSEKDAGIRKSFLTSSPNVPLYYNAPFKIYNSDQIVSFRRGGNVKSIVSLGNIVVALQENGRFSFNFGLVGSTEVINAVNSRVDSGSYRGAISTPYGVFFVNKKGLQQLVSQGQDNIPYSEQQVDVTNQLGVDYFDNIDFSSASLTYDTARKSVYVTCARDSVVNNLMLGYDIETGFLYEIQGWAISRFSNSATTIYGASSIDGSIYKLFDGFDDDGQSISTKIEYEFQLSGLYGKSKMNNFWIQCELANQEIMSIDFDKIDRNDNIVKNYKSYSVTKNGVNDSFGYDSQGYDSGFGQYYDNAGLKRVFDGASAVINDFHVLKVRVTTNSRLPSVFNYIAIEGVNKGTYRKRGALTVTN